MKLMSTLATGTPGVWKKRCAAKRAPNPPAPSPNGGAAPQTAPNAKSPPWHNIYGQQKALFIRELLRPVLYMLQNVTFSPSPFLLQQDNRIPVVKVRILSSWFFPCFFLAASVYKEYLEYNVLLYTVHNAAFLQPTQIESFASSQPIMKQHQD